MLVGSIMLGVMVDQVVKFIESLNLEAKMDRERKMEFALYLQESGRVPTGVREKALRAYGYYLKRKSTFLEEGTFDGIPPVVLNKLAVNLYGPVIRKVRLFQTMLQLEEKDFIVNLIMSAKPFEALSGELISESGDIATEIVFALNGEVRMWTHRGKRRVTEGFCTSGHGFGDFEHYSRMTRMSNYSAATDCRLLSLRMTDIDSMSERFEEAGGFFRRECRARYRSYLKIRDGPLAVRRDRPPGQEGSGASYEEPVTDAAGFLILETVWLNGEAIDYKGATMFVTAVSDELRAAEVTYQAHVGVSEEGRNLLCDVTLNELFWSHRVLHPNMTLKAAWDLLIAVFVVYSMLSVPIEVAFQAAAVGGWYVVDIAIDAFFLLDVLLSFRTTYFDEELQAFVIVSNLMARNYLRSWFAVDLLSSLPWDVIINDGLSSEVAGGSIGFKLFNSLRLLKLFRLARLGKYVTALEEWFTLSPTVFDLLKLFFRIFTICHFVSCVWWGLSSTMKGASWIDDPSMVYADNLRDGPLPDQYITSLYWAFTTLTTTGYGDITALSRPNFSASIFVTNLVVGTDGRILSICIEVFGSAVFGVSPPSLVYVLL